MTAAAHALLAPSSASRWVRCPGSVLAQMAVPPEPESEAAREGTLAHELAAFMLDDACRGLLPESRHDLRWKPQSNPYTEDMIRAAHGYAWEVFRVLRTLRIFGGPHMGIEDRLEIPSISEHCFGTTDAWVYSQEHDQLIIWDLKYGFKVVEPVDNWQLICYVIGIADRLECFNPDTKIHIRIYQPRAPHRLGIHRRWKTTWGDLEPQRLALKDAAWWALNDEPPTRTGPHCRYCRARYTCSALSLEAAAAAEYVSTPMPQELGGQGLAVELAILEAAQRMLEYRLTAIQEQAIQRIRAGATVPGYQVGHGRGSVVWSKPDEIAGVLEHLTGIDIRKGLMTPKQAQEAGIDPETIRDYSEHKPGKQTLRPVDTTAARMVFGGKSDE
jgi:hypothetical protein